MVNAKLVKRRGHDERYDSKKVYASSYYACKAVNMPEKNCEKVAEKVEREVSDWIKKQKIVSSDMIFKKIEKELKKLDKDAAFMYSTHRDVN